MIGFAPTYPPTMNSCLTIRLALSLVAIEHTSLYDALFLALGQPTQPQHAQQRATHWFSSGIFRYVSQAIHVTMEFLFIHFY